MTPTSKMLTAAAFALGAALAVAAAAPAAAAPVPSAVAGLGQAAPTPLTEVLWRGRRWGPYWGPRRFWRPRVWGPVVVRPPVAYAPPPSPNGPPRRCWIATDKDRGFGYWQPC